MVSETDAKTEVFHSPSSPKPGFFTIIDGFLVRIYTEADENDILPNLHWQRAREL